MAQPQAWCSQNIEQHLVMSLGHSFTVSAITLILQSQTRKHSMTSSTRYDRHHTKDINYLFFLSFRGKTWINDFGSTITLITQQSLWNTDHYLHGRYICCFSVKQVPLFVGTCRSFSCSTKCWDLNWDSYSRHILSTQPNSCRFRNKLSKMNFCNLVTNGFHSNSPWN